MSTTVFIDGEEDGLHAALRDRLDRAGASVSASRGSADIVVRLGKGEGGDIAVVPRDGSRGGSKLEVVVSDVIIPGWDSGWGCEEISRMVSGVKEGGSTVEAYEGTRYWVHVRDVVDALCTLILPEGERFSEGLLHLCGRRPWEGHDVREEIELLWNRFNDAINHSHTADSLSGIPSPVRGTGNNDGNRPDLAPLHSALIESGGEGWHPLVAMRTSLMESIALSE